MAQLANPQLADRAAPARDFALADTARDDLEPNDPATRRRLARGALRCARCGGEFREEWALCGGGPVWGCEECGHRLY